MVEAKMANDLRVRDVNKHSFLKHKNPVLIEVNVVE